jgi:hypothetical protein
VAVAFGVEGQSPHALLSRYTHGVSVSVSAPLVNQGVLKIISLSLQKSKWMIQLKEKGGADYGKKNIG